MSERRFVPDRRASLKQPVMGMLDFLAVLVLDSQRWPVSSSNRSPWFGKGLVEPKQNILGYPQALEVARDLLQTECFNKRTNLLGGWVFGDAGY